MLALGRVHCRLISDLLFMYNAAVCMHSPLAGMLVISLRGTVSTFVTRFQDLRANVLIAVLINESVALTLEKPLVLEVPRRS